MQCTLVFSSEGMWEGVWACMCMAVMLLDRCDPGGGVAAWSFVADELLNSGTRFRVIVIDVIFEV